MVKVLQVTHFRINKSGALRAISLRSLLKPCLKAAPREVIVVDPLGRYYRGGEGEAETAVYSEASILIDIDEQTISLVIPRDYWDQQITEEPRGFRIESVGKELSVRRHRRAEQSITRIILRDAWD